MDTVSFDLTGVIKKWKIGMFFVFFGTIFFALLFYAFVPRVYQSTVILKIGSAVQNFYFENSQTVIVLFNQQYFLKKIALKLGLSETDYPSVKAKIKLIDLNGLLRIDAFGANPQEAEKIAGVAASVLVERHEQMLGEELIRRTEFLRSKIAGLNSEIESIKSKMKSMPSSVLGNQAQMMLLLEQKESRKTYHELALMGQEGDLRTYRTRIEAPASHLEKPVKPNLKISILIAVILGAVLSFAWAFVRELFGSFSV